MRKMKLIKLIFTGVSRFNSGTSKDSLLAGEHHDSCNSGAAAGMTQSQVILSSNMVWTC